VKEHVSVDHQVDVERGEIGAMLSKLQPLYDWYEDDSQEDFESLRGPVDPDNPWVDIEDFVDEGAQEALDDIEFSNKDQFRRYKRQVALVKTALTQVSSLRELNACWSYTYTIDMMMKMVFPDHHWNTRKVTKDAFGLAATRLSDEAKEEQARLFIDIDGYWRKMKYLIKTNLRRVQTRQELYACLTIAAEVDDECNQAKVAPWEYDMFNSLKTQFDDAEASVEYKEYYRRVVVLRKVGAVGIRRPTGILSKV